MILNFYKIFSLFYKKMSRHLRYSDRLYRGMVKNACVLEPGRPPSLAHHRYRLEKLGQMGPKTFEGHYECGVMTHCLKPVLSDIGFDNVKLMYTRQNSGRHLEDHVYLLVNDNIVVDPTWRQFFSLEVMSNPKLEQMLYEEMPPIFIGNYGSLYGHVSLAIQHAGIKCKATQDSIYKNWRNAKEVPFEWRMLEMID
jgi:hypothetical protein